MILKRTRAAEARRRWQPVNASSRVRSSGSLGRARRSQGLPPSRSSVQTTWPTGCSTGCVIRRGRVNARSWSTSGRLLTNSGASTPRFGVRASVAVKGREPPTLSTLPIRRRWMPALGWRGRKESTTTNSAPSNTHGTCASTVASRRSRRNTRTRRWRMTSRQRSWTSVR